MARLRRRPAVAGTKKGVSEARTSRARVALGAIGLESEFTVFVDGQQERPEEIFRSPTAIVRRPMMHRTGRSYHLPTGGAIYFDTGVIEVATPVIEIARGCAARAGRSLWESILFVREELDAWERENGREVRLAGFSTHYNVSFDLAPGERRPGRSVGELAVLLTYILPVPVMLLAANRRSTGIGVRPRGNRIEVTADFTPDASLMIASATLITAIVREVMTWPSYRLSQLNGRDIPIMREFRPVPHSTRKGWTMRYDTFDKNPFQVDIDEWLWETTTGKRLSLREIGGRITRYFWPSIKQLSDPFTLRLIGAVMRGRAPSLLELADRPPEYEDVGRLCTWENLFPERILPRSRYERVLIHAISGQRLRLGDDWYTPTGMRGWSHVIFRRAGDFTRHIFSLDYLLDHLHKWERRVRRPPRRLPELADRAPRPGGSGLAASSRLHFVEPEIEDTK